MSTMNAQSGMAATLEFAHFSLALMKETLQVKTFFVRATGSLAEFVIAFLFITTEKDFFPLLNAKSENFALILLMSQRLFTLMSLALAKEFLTKEEGFAAIFLNGPMI